MRQIAVSLFLQYLRAAARMQLLKIRPKHIVGITGSAGKSSCREAVAVILSDRFKIKQSSSGNSETGLPMDILGFTGEHDYSLSFWLKVLFFTPWKLLTNWEKYDIYVAEMGVDKPGDMDFLLSIFRPDIGVLLNAAATHTQNFISGDEDRESAVAAVAREKGKLIRNLPDGGWAVINSDDGGVRGLELEKKLAGRGIRTTNFGNRGEAKPFLVDLTGYLLTADYGYTLAAAAAVGLVLDIPVAHSKELLRRKFRLPPGRMSVFQGIKGTTIIDSSYNSSLQPAVGALQLLKKATGRRKIAVLGDMRELGKLAKSEHELLAREAVKDADQIFTFGPLMREYFLPEARRLGFGDKVMSEMKMLELIERVKNFLQKGDTILVKGSQNTIFLEILVEKLLANPADREKLCRRGKFWEEKRREVLDNG